MKQGSTSLVDRIRRGAAWYKDELRTFSSQPGNDQRNVPTRLVELSLVLPDAATLAVQSAKTDAKHQRFAKNQVTTLAEAFQNACMETGLPAVLSLPEQTFLLRTFDMPRAAYNRLPAILDQDVERKTPFALQDIFHTHRVTAHASAPDKLTVQHWIIAKSDVATTLAAWQLDTTEFTYLKVGSGDAAPNMPLQQLAQPAKPKRGRLIASLIVLTCIMATIAVGRYWTGLAQYRADIAAKTKTSATKAAEIRKSLDSATKDSALFGEVRLQKTAYPNLVDVWEELTRLLPDGTWLTELALSETAGDGRMVMLSGLSESATALVAHLNRSQYFSDASLNSAITPDPIEQRERFTLRATLKKGSSIPTAGKN